MEKGSIKIKNSGSAELKKANGKWVPIPKTFDLIVYIPESGSKTVDCDYEIDENGVPKKIIIGGINIEFNKLLIERKQATETKKQAEVELNKKEEIERKANKELIEFLKDDFVDINKAFLPNDSRKILINNAVLGDKWRVSNFSLKLNKLARYEGEKFQFFKTEKGKIEFQPKHHFDIDLISEIQNKNLKLAESLISKENLFVKTLKPDWRMVVGLGSESVYETSMTLHHIYGIPYIPASSIKGVVRSWIIMEYFGNPEMYKYFPKEQVDFPLVNAEFRALTESESFCKIFGCPREIKAVKFENNKPVFLKDRRGNETEKYEKEKNAKGVAIKNKKGESTEHIGIVIFFDAFPTESPKIEQDIMNVHYPKHYGGPDAPTDTQSPIPIPFLTVKDTEFQFIIGSKKEPTNNFYIGKTKDGKDKTIDIWLKEALEIHGIGAKTAVGYGRMK